jgi:hypothetical protein
MVHASREREREGKWKVEGIIQYKCRGATNKHCKYNGTLNPNTTPVERGGEMSRPERKGRGATSTVAVPLLLLCCARPLSLRSRFCFTKVSHGRPPYSYSLFSLSLSLSPSLSFDMDGRGISDCCLHVQPWNGILFSLFPSFVFQPPQLAACSLFSRDHTTWIPSWLRPILPFIPCCILAAIVL